jgi:5-methylthioadenosine/S-adenosylhomocysteine deaminase
MHTMPQVDLLIEARWVVPIAPRNTVFADHAVAVSDGRIVAIGPKQQLAARFEAREHLVRSSHALLPGLVDAHTRAATTLLRGRLEAEGRAGAQRLEQQCLREEFVRDGTQLALAQMLRAGITCFADDSAHPDEVARLAAAARMRAVIGLPVSDAGTGWAQGATAHLARAEQVWDEYRSDPHVSLRFAPDAEASSDATLVRVRTVADELDARIAAPVHESQAQVDASLARSGRRPLQRLAEVGLLRPGFVALHLNRLDAADLELVRRTGIAATVCPQLSLRSGNAPPPVLELCSREVVVGLGSGNPGRIGAPDLLREARTTLLMASARGGEPDALPPWEVLRLATLGGAAALGLPGIVGTIEPGKAADLIAVDLGSLTCQPVASLAEALLFGATGEHVSDVWLSGRAALAHGHLLSFDEQELRERAQHWSERLAQGQDARSTTALGSLS